MLLVKLDGGIEKNETVYMLLLLNKTHLQIDQGPRHKAGYPESDRRESREHAQTRWHRQALSE